MKDHVSRGTTIKINSKAIKAPCQEDKRLATSVKLHSSILYASLGMNLIFPEFFSIICTITATKVHGWCLLTSSIDLIVLKLKCKLFMKQFQQEGFSNLENEIKKIYYMASRFCNNDG